LLLAEESLYGPITKRISSPPLRLLDAWKCLMFYYYIGTTESYFTHELALLIQNTNGSSIKLWGTPYGTNKWIYVQVPFSIGAQRDKVSRSIFRLHSRILSISF
jgi:hypothetical protein